MGTLRFLSLSVVLAFGATSVFAQDSLGKSKGRDKERPSQSQSRDSRRSSQDRSVRPSRDQGQSPALGRIGGSSRDRSADPFGRTPRDSSLGKRDRGTDPFDRSSRDTSPGKSGRDSGSLRDRVDRPDNQDKRDRSDRPESILDRKDRSDRGTRSDSPIGRVLGSIGDQDKQRDQRKDTRPPQDRSNPGTRDLGKSNRPPQEKMNPGSRDLGKATRPPQERTNPGSRDQGRSTRPPLIKANPGFPDNGGTLGKIFRAKSGRSNYGSVSNLRNRSRGSIVIDCAPRPGRGGGLPSWVLREDTARIRYYNSRGGYRDGYCHYDSGWRDDYFCYPHYAFRPSRGCTISPWYYYPHLPAYLLITRIIFQDNYRCDFNEGNQYRWDRNDGFYDRFDGNSELNQSLRDLENAFEDRDDRSLGRLVSRSHNVGVWVDGQYSYSLPPDDFFDLMMDNIQGTRTIRYDITSVRKTYDGARVSAIHEFDDPWGGTERVYHRYRLQRDGYGYYIADFQTSQSGF